MQDAYILNYVRTPIGRFQGGLSPLTAPELGGRVISHLVKNGTDLSAQVDEVIFGNVISAGIGQNPARQAALKGGLPTTIPAFTVNKVCGSGMKAAMLAAQSIVVGESELVVAGGMESMTNAPYLLPGAREGHRLGHGKMLDSMIQDGLWCAFENWHMGNAADHIADKFEVTRRMQDEYAAQSHERADRATKEGKFAAEILPVEIETRKGTVRVETDEGIRPGTTAEDLEKLRTAFNKEGTVTAGNASQISDGAAALLIGSEAGARKAGKKPVARIAGYATSGVDPKEIFHAPVPAIEKLLEKTGRKMEEIDRFELNEAFAAQAMANGKALGVEWGKVNVFGGAVALGHPIGCSGARILCTLLTALEDCDGKYGIAAACLGGGNAVSILVERL